jgi:hypothetical protein
MFEVLPPLPLLKPLWCADKQGQLHYVLFMYNALLWVRLSSFHRDTSDVFEIKKTDDLTTYS